MVLFLTKHSRRTFNLPNWVVIQTYALLFWPSCLQQLLLICSFPWEWKFSFCLLFSLRWLFCYWLFSRWKLLLVFQDVTSVCWRMFWNWKAIRLFQTTTQRFRVGVDRLPKWLVVYLGDVMVLDWVLLFFCIMNFILQYLSFLWCLLKVHKLVVFWAVWLLSYRICISTILESTRIWWFRDIVSVQVLWWDRLGLNFSILRDAWGWIYI